MLRVPLLSAAINSADVQTEPEKEVVRMQPRHGDSRPSPSQRIEISQFLQSSRMKVPKLSTEEITATSSGVLSCTVLLIPLKPVYKMRYLGGPDGKTLDKL